MEAPSHVAYCGAATEVRRGEEIGGDTEDIVVERRQRMWTAFERRDVHAEHGSSMRGKVRGEMTYES